MAAATPLVLNTGRQYPLVLQQSFTFANLDGALQTLIAKIPRNAVITAGNLQVSTAFGAGSTLSFGTAASATAYGTIDTATTGAKALTLTGAEVGAADLFVKASGTLTAGAATLYLTYVLTDRANEVQP